MILESAIALAPTLTQMYDQEVSVYVSDTQQFRVAINHPKLNLGVREGDLLQDFKKSITNQALEQGKRLEVHVEKHNSLFGIAYAAISQPLMEEDKIVGVLSIALSMERYNQLIIAGEEILAASQQMSASAESLSSTSEELAATAEEMNESTGQVTEELSHVDQITNEIKKISAQSNILGINASIEAARAGEYGRGFSVVANEVRKLADHTKIANKTIEEDVNNIQASVERMILSVSDLAKMSETQAQGVMEMMKALEQITHLAEQLVEMGKRNS